MIINVRILDNNIETSANVHVMCSSLSLAVLLYHSLCSTVESVARYWTKFLSGSGLTADKLSSAGSREA